MLPRREPRQSAEPSFPDIAQLGEAIVSAIQSAFCTPQRTPLETVYNLKLTHFIGKKGHEEVEKWLNHIEKTFLVMQSQGNLLPDRWVETTTWFLGEQPASWFIPLEYIDRKKQEFTHLKQGKMSANKYYRMFTDMLRYDPEVDANPVEMLRRFRLGAKKKWRSIVTSTHCATNQEFYEILLRIVKEIFVKNMFI
ncbi:hypothetical protein ACFX2G_032967 [Malus domestica]